MQIFEQIRTYFHEKALEKELSKTSIVPRYSVSLEDAKSIGLLFDGTLPEDRECVLDFAKQLKNKGKTVSLLAFFNSDLKSHDFTFTHFNRSQLDLALRPKPLQVLDFVERPFDLLINLSQTQVLPLEYVAAKSKAKFRVGPSTDKTFCYDLMIDFPGKKNLKAFLDQVIFYLKKLQPKHELSAI